jgi:CheY-like chemotaxis protein
MDSGFRYRILVVDDEETILLTSARVLELKGFEVRTAPDGFAALVELRKALPDLLISDLRMPNMSGFELLSIVRRRFPHIPVIAISGEFNGTMPAGLIADYFLSKGSYHPEDLFTRIADLIERSPMRPSVTKPERAPVWIPRNAEGYFVVTCTDCLRSFSVPDEEAQEEVRSISCPHCEVIVRFLAQPSVVRARKGSSG